MAPCGVELKVCQISIWSLHRVMVASYPEADVGKEWKVGRWLVRKDVAKQVFGGATKSGWF